MYTNTHALLFIPIIQYYCAPCYFELGYYYFIKKLNIFTTKLIVFVVRDILNPIIRLQFIHVNIGNLK